MFRLEGRDIVQGVLRKDLHFAVHVPWLKCQYVYIYIYIGKIMRIRLDIVVSCALQSALQILAYLYLDGIRLDPSGCNAL